jgi:hypothetical protein
MIKFNFFQAQLGEIRNKITRKSKLESQSRAKLKKLKTKNLFTNDTRIQGPNSVENKGEIEEIRSLKVN